MVAVYAVVCGHYAFRWVGGFYDHFEWLEVDFSEGGRGDKGVDCETLELLLVRDAILLSATIRQ